MCDSKKINKTITNVDINLDNDFVTQKTAANMLLSIVKFLLFNRNQIPFVYETFNYMTKRLETARSAQNVDGTSNTFAKNYAMERQQDIAIQTYHKFNEISDILLKSFEKYEMEQAIIIFGATTFTSKEAFIINLPNVSKNHFAVNHPNSSENVIRKVIRSIITSTNFFDVNCNELKPTNMYVLLKPKYEMSGIGDEFKIRSSLKLPTSCRKTHINIQSDPANIQLNCCQSLDIFSDIETSNHTSEKIADDNTNELKNQSTINGEKTSTTHDNFYECNIVIKGFKDQLVKGKSIWTQNASHQHN